MPRRPSARPPAAFASDAFAPVTLPFAAIAIAMLVTAITWSDRALAQTSDTVCSPASEAVQPAGAQQESPDVSPLAESTDASPPAAIPEAPLPLAIGDTLTTFAAPCRFPSGLAWRGISLWVADWEDGRLFELNPRNGAVRRVVDAPCYHPEGLASDGTLLYVSDYATGLVHVFDPDTGLTQRTYGSPESSPKDLAFGGGSLWLVDDGTDTIYQMVPHDGTILNYYKAPHGSCRGLAHDGRYLWVTDRMKDELYAVRPSDGKVVFLVKTPGPFPIGLASGDGSLWLADLQSGRIARLNTRAERPYSVSDWVTRDFRYHYALRNDGDGTVVEAAIMIAVPYAALENQELVAPVTWEPEPDQVTTDRWGQPVAIFRYRNVARETAVTAGYSTRVRLGELHYAFDPDDVGGLDTIPVELRAPNTMPTSRLQLDRDEIQSAARDIVGDETNPYWIARKIFDWVNERLEYERVGGWDVPTTLLKRGTGSCSEYAFLYIALCRAAGLPARYEGSVAVRGDDASMDDVHHRWCEVYLPGVGWMPVDPSGGDQEWPADQARYFGGMANRFIITTHGGGDSELLGWRYNGNATYVYEGRGNVYEEAYGVWSAVAE